MPDWKAVRDDFPAARDKAYFMSAAMSPTPVPVFERIVAEYRRIHEHGDIFWDEDVNAHRRILAATGKLLNCGGTDLAFVANTSTAMGLIAAAFKAHAGRPFNVVSLADEFPASTVPFEHAGVCMKYVRSREGRYPVDAVLAEADGDTLAVVASHVQYATGFRLDLAELGPRLRERGVAFIVNATQSFPIFEIDCDAMGIDALSASLHKWGMIGHVGALLYTRPSFRRRFPVPIAGWLSIASPEGLIHTGKNARFELREGADQYVAGCINFQAINAFEASLHYIEGVGRGEARGRILELAGLLVQRLRDCGAAVVSPVERPEERSGIVAFNAGPKTSHLPEHLKRRGVFVSYRNGNVRAAVNIFNDESDIERLIAGVRDFKGDL